MEGEEGKVRAGRPAAVRIAPVLVAEHAAATAVERPDDPGPYVVVGTWAKHDGGQWMKNSSVVASPRAVYILRGDAAQMSRGGAWGWLVGGKVGRAMGGGAGGGLIGWAIVRAASAGAEPVDRRRDAGELRTCSVRELPDSARKAADPKGLLTGRGAIVLTKGSVTRVRPGFSHYTFVCGGVTFKVMIPMFGGRRIRKFLVRNGWTAGAEVAATERPTFA